MSARAMVENLEARYFLSADLTVAFPSPFPSALSLINNTLPFKIQNIGDTPAAGSATVTLYASADITLDGGDTPLGSKTIPAHILTGRFAVAPVKFPSPAALSTGSYYLLADVQGDASVGDNNAVNNIVASSTLVQIQQPFVDLTAQIKLTGPSTIKAGKPAPTTITLFNQGNITATGSAIINVNLSTSSDGSSPIAFTTLSPHIHISPHGHATFAASKIIPLGTPPNNYFSVAQIQSTTFTQTDTSNDSTVSPTARTVVSPFVNLVGTLTGNAVSTRRFVTATILNVTTESDFDGSISGTGTVTPAGTDPLAVTFTGAVSTTGAVTIHSINSVNSATLKARVVHSKLIGTYVASDGSRGAFSLAIALHPPGPSLSAPLNSDITTVIVGNPEIDHFNATVANADSATTVEVDEVDANGNLIGKLTDLVDNGSAADGDAAANDGIFSGLNTISFNTTGQRYFRANVLESGSSIAVSPAITIPGVNPPTQQQIQQDTDDDTALNQLAQNTIANGGSVQSALDVLSTELHSDSNVDPTSIASSSHAIEWTNIDGFPDAIDFAASTGTSTRSAPPQATPLDSIATPQDSTTGSKPALVISPFDWDFQADDEAFPIISMLQQNGYDPKFFINSASSDTLVSIENFKNLGQYDTVVISSHGDDLPKTGLGILTGVKKTFSNSFTYASDLYNGRLQEINGYLAITPKFIRAYAGSLNDSIIYVSSCFSAADESFAGVFLAAGADSYLGFTDEVSSQFAYQQGVAAYTTLLKSTGNTVMDIPGIDKTVDPYGGTSHAKFVEIGNQLATLPQSSLLKNFDVYVRYTWPQVEDDLDSSTGFLGTTAGYNQPGGAYLNWSGDDTGSGGSEITLVNIYQAWLDKAWAGTTTITAAADWYSNAEIPGSGPAVLTIGLEQKITGKLIDITTHTINPNQETDGATTLVATINITLSNDADPTITLSVT